MILLMLNMPILPTWCIFYPLQELSHYFSNWGTVFVMISLLACLFAPYDLKIHQKTEKLAIIHLIITFSAFMHLIIVPVFWGVLYTEAIRSVRFGLAEKIFQFYSHIIPAFAAFTNLFITDVVLLKRHLPLLLTFGLVYLSVNWYKVTHRVWK